MEWELIEQTLGPELERLLSDVDLKVVWAGQNTAEGWAPDIFVELDKLSLATIGRDELRTTDAIVDGVPVLNRTVFGNRRFVVQVKIDTQDQTLSATAMAYASRLMGLLLACPDTYENLKAACLGVSGVRSIRSMDYCDCDGRKRSASVFDLILNTSSVIDCGTVQTVAAAVVDGTVLYQDGTTALDETYRADA